MGRGNAGRGRSAGLALGSLVVAVLAFGCATLLPAPAPLVVVRHPQDGQSSRTLVVLLPGRFDDAGDFARNSFPQSALRAGITADLVAVDATLGYYARRTVIDRLRQDVVLPARARGYQRIYIAGVSLGALGGLLYARDHGDEIDGVLAIAPFLGERALIDEIASAGGLLAWSPPAARGDEFRDLWQWLQGEASPAAAAPPLWLAWGVDDDFGRANRLLADVLPPERVFTAQGGHDWRTWRRLWEEWLARAPLPRAAPSSDAPNVDPPNLDSRTSTERMRVVAPGPVTSLGTWWPRSRR